MVFEICLAAHTKSVMHFFVVVVIVVVTEQLSMQPEFYRLDIRSFHHAVFEPLLLFALLGHTPYLTSITIRNTFEDA